MRTFPLISLTGFILAWMAQEVGAPNVLAVGVLGIFAFALVVVWVRHHMGQSGITTPAAIVLTFLLGVVIAYGFTFEAVVIGVAATFLLVTKKRLHRFARLLDDQEILSALQFLTILFILLPLSTQIPEDALGIPWLGRGELVDPSVILLIVVFVSALSFASLIAMRMVGPRKGIEFSGLLGGLVNSEATTASLAHRSKESPLLLPAAIVGSLLATATMLFRNVAIAAFADRSLSLVAWLLPFVIPVAVVGIALAWRARTEGPEPHEEVRVKNPFAVLPALRFALFFALISLAVTVARESFGEAGVYIAALGGFVSSGAVVASLASLYAAGAIPLGLALETALLAMTASVAAKLVILRAIDEPTFRRALLPYALFTLAGILASIVAFVLP